jgi:hypothetical protein
MKYLLHRWRHLWILQNEDREQGKVGPFSSAKNARQWVKQNGGTVVRCRHLDDPVTCPELKAHLGIHEPYDRVWTD